MDEFEKKNFMVAMGCRVRAQRERLNLSQEELACRLNYKNKASISRIESGMNEIPQSKMRAFAAALDTSIEYLMGWESKRTVSVSSLSEEETDIILCFRRADSRDRATVKNVLDRYREDTSLSAG